jgi:hypothetical protein
VKETLRGTELNNWLQRGWTQPTIQRAGSPSWANSIPGSEKVGNSTKFWSNFGWLIPIKTDKRHEKVANHKNTRALKTIIHRRNCRSDNPTAQASP